MAPNAGTPATTIPVAGDYNPQIGYAPVTHQSHQTATEPIFVAQQQLSQLARETRLFD